MKKNLKDKKFGWKKDRDQYQMIAVYGTSHFSLKAETRYYLVDEIHTDSPNYVQARLIGTNGHGYLFTEYPKSKYHMMAIKGHHKCFGKSHMRTVFWPESISLID